MNKNIRSYKKESILKAINLLGVESLCGVSEINKNEVFEFTDMMQDFELIDICNCIEKNNL